MSLAICTLMSSTLSCSATSSVPAPAAGTLLALAFPLAEERAPPFLRFWIASELLFCDFFAPPSLYLPICLLLLAIGTPLGGAACRWALRHPNRVPALLHTELCTHEKS